MDMLHPGALRLADHRTQDSPTGRLDRIMRIVERIWHIGGSVPVPAGQSNDEAFDRLAPLFRQAGTSHERTNDTLTFRKKDPAAQDKMSIFDGGVLRIEGGVTGAILRYHLTSRTLLLCFLAPLLFLASAQLTVAIGKYKSAHTETAVKKPQKDKVLPQNALDKALGAPAPEKPKKDKDKDKKPSPTSSYVFAGMFAALYLVGRVLEDRLVRALFRKALLTS
jgi:hypothetical protein